MIEELARPGGSGAQGGTGEERGILSGIDVRVAGHHASVIQARSAGGGRTRREEEEAVAAAEVAEAGAIGVEPGLSAAEKREWLRPQSHAARPAAARVGQRERRGPPCRATTMLGKRGGAFLRGRLGASFVNVVKYRSMCRNG